MSFVSQPCKNTKRPTTNKLFSTKMNQVLHNRFAVGKIPAGNFQSIPTKKRRANISFNEHEGYLIDIEKDLMKKFKLGRSGLHKYLLLKEGQQQFGSPFIG